jgi:hypothetical protein
MLLRPSADVRLKDLTRGIAEFFNSLLAVEAPGDGAVRSIAAGVNLAKPSALGTQVITDLARLASDLRIWFRTNMN